jgi:anti-sigma B factor antagonist
MTTLPGGHMVVALCGEIDMLTVPAVREVLAEATRRAVTGVIIDLAEVTFLDAAGLGALAGASGRARHLPGGLRLAAVPPRALRLLTLTGLDRHLAIFPAPPRREQPADAGPRPQPPPDRPPQPCSTKALRCNARDARPLRARTRNPVAHAGRARPGSGRTRTAAACRRMLGDHRCAQAAAERQPPVAIPERLVDLGRLALHVPPQQEPRDAAERARDQQGAHPPRRGCLRYAMLQAPRVVAERRVLHVEQDQHHQRAEQAGGDAARDHHYPEPEREDPSPAASCVQR